MRVRKPSPSMVVSCVALVMASTGTAVAAVNYADNAGKVDGKDAVHAGAKLSQAAGDVVATNKSGTNRGKIPGKFLADVMRGGADSFSRPAEVQDNAADVPDRDLVDPGARHAERLVLRPEPQRRDRGSRNHADVRQPVGRRGERRAADRRRQPERLRAADEHDLAVHVGGSNTFRLHIEKQGTNYVIEGVVRQDGRGSPAASCLVYGYALRVADVA